MISAIEIKISIDAEDVNTIAEIMNEVEELNSLVPEWNNIEKGKVNKRINELLVRKFLKAEEAK